MKRLHKKIGVGVLVAGLLLGGAGGLGGSVAHANKLSQEELDQMRKDAILSELNEEQKLAVKRVYERLNIPAIVKGREVDLLDARDISGGKEGVKLHSGGSIHYKYRFKNINGCLDDFKYIISNADSSSFVKLRIDNLRLEILLIVL